MILVDRQGNTLIFSDERADGKYLLFFEFKYATKVTPELTQALLQVKQEDSKVLDLPAEKIGGVS